jgi:hypothetical protein
MPESKYTQALADEICALLEQGQSLNAICKNEGMPTEAAVRLWARDDHEGFASKYTRAREIGYLRLADEIIEISDDGSRDYRKDEDGHETVDHDHIARSRLRVDSRKWMLSKMLPKVYGDKLALTDADGGRLTINVLPRAHDKPAA